MVPEIRNLPTSHQTRSFYGEIRRSLLANNRPVIPFLSHENGTWKTGNALKIVCAAFGIATRKGFSAASSHRAPTLPGSLGIGILHTRFVIVFSVLIWYLL